MMALGARRILGVPIPFLTVLVLVVLLTIFFGAWAVSADGKSTSRSFYFALGGSGVSIQAPETSPASGEAPGATEGTESSADTWWGSGLLKACPFH